MSPPSKILFAGETAIIETRWVVGTDFFTECQYRDFSHYLGSALTDGGYEVDHVPVHMVAEHFPGTVEQLSAYDAVVLSDVGANSLLLHPDVTFKSEPRFNRLSAIERYVQEGGALMMAGGWMSFQGFQGQARFHRTPIETVLPVRLHQGIDDRMEMPEGFRPQIVEAAAEHPVVKGIPRELPPMVFYNQLLEQDGAEVLMRHGDDPILAVWDYGQGRSAAFAPDIAPHGATEAFLSWEHYGPLFRQLLDWLTRR